MLLLHYQHFNTYMMIFLVMNFILHTAYVRQHCTHVKRNTVLCALQFIIIIITVWILSRVSFFLLLTVRKIFTKNFNLIYYYIYTKRLRVYDFIPCGHGTYPSSKEKKKKTNMHTHTIHFRIYTHTHHASSSLKRSCAKISSNTWTANSSPPSKNAAPNSRAAFPSNSI